jgi:hypothetical protein
MFVDKVKFAIAMFLMSSERNRWQILNARLPKPLTGGKAH